MKVNDYGVKAVREELESIKNLLETFPGSLELKGRLGGLAYAAYMLDIITDEEYSNFKH